MTVVKQTSVKSPRHLKRLESYLDWEIDKALDHEHGDHLSETVTLPMLRRHGYQGVAPIDFSPPSGRNAIVGSPSL